jgi:ABC-2 type transport system permease protein
MRRYIRIYQRLWKINATKLVIYRGNFYNSVVVSIMWAAFSLISIMLLTSRNPVVFGWSREELMLLTALYSVIVGMFHVLFTRNLEQFSRIVHRGQFDMHLVKPVDAQFMVSTTIVNYSGIPRVIIALLYAWYLSGALQISVNIPIVLTFLFVCIVGIFTLYAFWFGALTITIWQSQLFNLSDLLTHITDSAKYPTEMYGEFRYYITLFLFPLSLIVTLPTKILLGTAQPWQFFLLFSFCSGIIVLSRLSWKYMLRFYTSANS